MVKRINKDPLKKKRIRKDELHYNIGLRGEPRSKTGSSECSAVSESEFAVATLEVSLLSKGHKRSELPWILNSRITGRYIKKATYANRVVLVKGCLASKNI